MANGGDDSYYGVPSPDRRSNMPAKKRGPRGSSETTSDSDESNRANATLATGATALSGQASSVIPSVLQDPGSSVAPYLGAMHTTSLLRAQGEVEQQSVLAHHLLRQQQRRALERQLLLQQHHANSTFAPVNTRASLPQLASPGRLSFQERLLLQQNLLRTQNDAGLMPPTPIGHVENSFSAAATSDAGYSPARLALTGGMREPLPLGLQTYQETKVPRDNPDVGQDVNVENAVEDGEESPESIKKKLLNEAFPKKLYRILEDAEREGNEDIIAFLPSGNAFVVVNSNRFVSELMPRYFTTKRLTSFQRQLNMYCFKRIAEGVDRGGYFHPAFLKNHKDLLPTIRRKKGPAAPGRGMEDMRLERQGVGSQFAGVPLDGMMGLSGPAGVDNRARQMLMLLQQRQQLQQEQQLQGALTLDRLLSAELVSRGAQAGALPHSTLLGGASSPYWSTHAASSQNQLASILGPASWQQRVGISNRSTAAAEEQQRRLAQMVQLAHLAEQDRHRGKLGR